MPDTETVTLTIEGTEVSVPKGTTVLEAARQVGITVPHYCYHPGLPIAGVCRMCLVEIEGAPTLQPSCATLATDGQKVSVYSEKAVKARQGVLEFLLINHPLDCPICDQAGECELQDFVFEEARGRSRYSPTYAKRFDPVEDFGGDVLYVPNRCILCTRCVRFMEHLAQDPIISVQERGNRAFIGVHPDRGMDHPWAGNVVDLCPVGSLISKDFLHKARAWELDRTPSICTGCSQGCNVYIETRQDVIVRIRARENRCVNRFFMCDVGRSTYKDMIRGDRIEAPLTARGGTLTAVDWDQALAHAAKIIGGSGGRAVALASPHASTEALFFLKEVLSRLEFVGGFRVKTVGEDVPLPGVENLALRSERAPNGMGAKLLGYTEDFREAVKTIDGAAVLMVLGELLDDVTADVLGGAANMIYLGETMPDVARSAQVVLPTTTTAEEDGTFVNRDCRVQRYVCATPPRGMARPAWKVLSRLLSDLEHGEPVEDASQAFGRLAGKESPFRGLSYQQLGEDGAVVQREQVAEVKE